MQTRNAGYLGLVLMAALAIGCAKVDDSGNDTLGGGGDGGLGNSKAGAYSLFDPVAASAVIPFPNDVLFAGFKDPTLNIPNSANISFVTAANRVDGFSTTASLFTDFIGFIDYNSVLDCSTFPVSTPAILIVNVTNPLSPSALTPCLDYTIQVSTAIDDTGAPINAYRSRVLIEPLHPLAESSRYIVVLTDAPVSNLFGVPGFNLGAVTSTDGVAATPADLFTVVKSATPVTSQTGPALTPLTEAQKETLEELRVQAIQPVLAGLCGPGPGCAGGIPPDNVLIAWSFTTESVNKTLVKVNSAATAHTIAVANTTISTGDLGLGLADTADIYAGILSVPYYLANLSRKPTDPLHRFWLADTSPAKTDLAASFLGQVPCGAFLVHATLPNGITVEPSFSTTTCFPFPVKRSDETIPLLVTVPNANSPSAGTPPGSGWPVVIFQHGITRNRTDMLAIGPTLASAGFVTVAIDMPLHGITNTVASLTNPFYRNQLFFNTPAAALMTGERTFNLNFEANPPNSVDPSGTYFINLSDLLVSRDNLRQAVADLIVLAKSVGGLSASGIPIDTNKIYYVGHSLGAIVGTTLLGVNTDIRAATLAMPGGGLAGLLDSSATFGPIVSAGLAAEGVAEGSDNYETFLRFAQQVTDPGDPINFAADAAANHAIHMIEVIGDTVVPNAGPALAVATASQDVTPLTRYLSGTDALWGEMGLQQVGPLTVNLLNSPPITAQAPVTGASVKAVVQFTDGNHGSILNPAGGTTNAVVTCTMQKETATFLATDGTILPVGGACP